MSQMTPARVAVFRESLMAELLEIEKAAARMAPHEIVGETLNNLNLRREASPTWGQLVRPGPSLFGGAADKLYLWRTGKKVKRQAFRELANTRKDANLEGARTLGEQNDALSKIIETRKAERALQNGGGGGEKGLFSREDGKPTSSITGGKGRQLRNLMFGAGVGGAGVLAAQHQLSQGGGEAGYEEA